MKIRIKGNFVRYRLTKTEVETLAQEGRMIERTIFGPDVSQQFEYALELKKGIDALQAVFEGRRITLYLPEAEALPWAEGDRVGFENEMQTGPDSRLKLLLEKDFVCLDDTDEDQSDNYPNPRSVC
ncbi:MAG: hypothetical protein KDC70_19045 [Saprospiraceae bacterium]|nr:hypothetical protein [Saprospiraceae bacterium]